MSQPLKDMTRALFNWDDAEAEYMEANKDTPQNALYGWSYRAFQIALSEDFIKPKLGGDAFGRLASRIIQRSPSSLFICSDSGFAEEAVPIVRTVGAANVLLVQLQRQGHTFRGDSRSYISLPSVRTVKLENNGSLTDFKEQLCTVVDVWMQED